MRILLLPCLLFALSAEATTLIYNVKGYTMNREERLVFSALEYDDGVVTRLYSTADAAARSTAETRIDGEGATLLPGLIDAHGHVGSLGAALSRVDLTAAESEAAAAARVAAFMEEQEADGWIRGRGWNQVLWPDRVFPHRSSLDAVTGDRPAAFERIDGHALWVNSAALKAAGIDRDSADPEGGQIIRDAAGDPTGVLVDNAMRAVFDAIGEPGLEELERDIERGLQASAAVGLTSVHDAGISLRELQAYQSLQRQQRLTIRSYPMLSVLDPANDQVLRAGPGRSADGMLEVRSVKISADGALGSRGAALHSDYSDQPGHRGLLLLDDDILRQHIRRSAEAGFQVNVHAIGDLANTRVLDEFATLDQDIGPKVLRHRVEHAQILRPQDISRFRELGVIASIQPTHATSDKNMAGDRLGEERLAGAYAWNTLMTSGAYLAGGSDFPVEPPEPLFGLHAAVTRTDRQGNPLGGWRPEEKLSREQALSLFTEWAAYAGHAEDRLGRLLPGYAADFVLLDEDYFEVPEDDLWRLEVLMTVVAGVVVYEKPAEPIAVTGR